MSDTVKAAIMGGVFIPIAAVIGQLDLNRLFDPSIVHVAMPIEAADESVPDPSIVVTNNQVDLITVRTPWLSDFPKSNPESIDVISYDIP